MAVATPARIVRGVGAVGGSDEQFIKDLIGLVVPANKPNGEESRVFKSGLELIGLKLTVRNVLEFSIVLAGKDAPKLEQALAAIADSGSLLGPAVE